MKLRHMLRGCGPFPLTPALSPRERENSRQSVGESEATGAWARRLVALPLPKGEGWGEGEQRLRSPVSTDVPKPPRRCAIGGAQRRRAKQRAVLKTWKVRETRVWRPARPNWLGCG